MAHRYSSSSGEGPSSGRTGGNVNSSISQGHHYMPDGTIMADHEHPKNIWQMFGDFSRWININGEERVFTVTGEEGARYDVQVIDEDDKYYNFDTKIFDTASSAATKLKNNRISEGGESVFSVIFPAPGKIITYTVRLMPNHSCGVVKLPLLVAKRPDGTVNHNASTGFGGVIEKKIYGRTSSTLTLSCVSSSLDSGGETWVSATPRFGNATGAQTRANCFFGEDFTLNFSITLTATSGKSIRIIRKPTVNDLCSIIRLNIGSDPDVIVGEDIYPAITTPANSASEGGTTVNGASTGTTVTTHVVSSTIATVGDRVLGNAALAAATVTVATVSGGSGKTFTISEAISIADDLPLTFSNAKHHRWPVNNIVGIARGMTIDPGSATGANVLSGTKIADFRKYLKHSVPQPQDCDNYNPPKIISEVTASSPALLDGLTISYVEDSTLGYTNNVEANNGSITFNPAQALAFGGDTNVRFIAYGNAQIKQMTNMDISISDVEVTQEDITTTISDSSATGIASLNDFDVAAVTGIMDDVSVVTGAGISNVVSNPRVSAISSSNLTLTPGSHLVKNGETLTFTGANNVTTITGTIHVKNFTTAAGSILYFDVDRFLYSA